MPTTPESPRVRTAFLLVFALAVLTPHALPESVAAAGPWAWPVEGEVLTVYRNGDDPYAAGQHRGIDIGAPVGTDVHAASAGTVTFAGTAGSSGLTVSVRTADGRFDTAYLHLESAGVEEGDAVEDGTVLGTVGTSGRRSIEAPHVHFGVRDAGERHAYHDPLPFLGAPGAAPQPPAPSAPPARPAPGPARAPASSPAPAPRPAPAPAPSPRGAPAPSPGRLPAPSPKGAPSPAPVGAPAGRPRPLPGGAPHPWPRAWPRPAPAPSRAQSPDAAPAPARRGEPFVALAPDRGPASLRRAGALPAPHSEKRPHARPSGGGFDLGWALACAGVAVVAVVRPSGLGRPRARARVRASAPARLAR